MDPTDLPADLQALDALLRRRRVPEPPAGQRDRVLAAVRREVMARGLPWWRRPGAWQTAAAAAAVLVVWLNVAVGTVGERWDLPSDGRSVQALEVCAARIQALVPDLPRREAYRQALVLRAGVAPVAVAPRRGLGPAGRSLSNWKEVHAWVSP